MAPILIGLTETEDDGLHIVFDIDGARTSLHPGLAAALCDQLSMLLRNMVGDEPDDDEIRMVN